jgi:hypothetical protein
MPGRLKRLKRLREAWTQRKRSTELQMSLMAVKLSACDTDEGYLVRCLASDGGIGSLFPDIVTRKLLLLGARKNEIKKELDAICMVHRRYSMNVRRCEIIAERHKKELDQKAEATALEVAIDGFLGRKA